MENKTRRVKTLKIITNDHVKEFAGIFQIMAKADVTDKANAQAELDAYSSRDDIGG